MDKNDPTRVSAWDIIVAGTLLTRLPLPQAPASAMDAQSRSVWAFPIVGLVVGILMAVVGGIAMALGLGSAIAAGLMLGTSMIVTGAMHEDGLADCADGFWGGFDPARRLEIMKDSQIGTYGVLALVVVTGLRWVALAALINIGCGAVIAAAVLSRAMMPIAMNTMTHARDTGLAHTVGTPATRVAQGAVLLGLVIALFAAGWSALFAVLVALACAAAVRLVAQAKIGGQTGDVLGATQILSETAILVALIAL